MSEDADRLIADAYSEIAPYYVRLWSPVLLPLGRQLLDRLPLDGARRVLDLGTGSGTLIDDLAQRASGATLVAADIAEGMLRVAKKGHTAAFAATNALGLPFASGRFDVVVSSFVMFNVPDVRAAFEEVLRVLTPGGTFGMTTWGDEPEDAAMDLWNEELDAHGAPEDRAVPQGREDIDTPEKLSALLNEAGFASPMVWTDRLAHQWNPDDWLEFIRHGRRRLRLDAMPGEARERCLARVTERLATLTHEQLTERSEVIFATATSRTGT
ncbi:MAG: methyltransferase domain-containing protein [Actinomycetota bacterium]